MLSITSKTTTERLLRSAALATLISVFCGLFLWDGYVGYPRANADELTKLLGLPSNPRPVIHRNLTAPRGVALAATWRLETKPEEVTTQLGEPGLKHGNDNYYLGPGGHLRVRTANGTVSEAEWVSGRNGDEELAWQRGIGFALLLPALLAILHLLRVAAFRVTVTDTHLAVSGKRPIPFNAITGVVSGGRHTDRCVTIRYKCDDRTRTLTLDSYRVSRWDAIVAAVCAKTGLDNPLAEDVSPSGD